MQNISSHLTWTHYSELVTIKKPDVLKFYTTQAINNRWSVRELRRIIKNKEYEKQLQKKKTPTFPPKSIPSIQRFVCWPNEQIFDLLSRT